ncbi:DUF4271 domain-containing protein [Bacteroides sedimenti]|uniref:DUF4271 domain-containing protein n=1 Tax=Bacteroides sedimenti TaxID=2136147 RepID=UPI0033409BDB
MIVVVKDSIQKPVANPLVATPVKVQPATTGTSGTSKTQASGKNITSAGVQSLKKQISAQGQTINQADNQATQQSKIKSQKKGSEPQNQQPVIANTDILLQHLQAQNDSIKAHAEATDSIRKAQQVAPDTIPLYYKTHFIPGDSIKWTSTGHLPSGIDGTPIPYRLRADNAITGLLLFCFILTAYVFTNGKKGLIEQTKNLFSRKEHSDFLGRATASDLRYRVMLQFQTCILLGVFCFDYFHDYNPLELDNTSIYCVLGIYIGIFVIYYGIKWMIYKFLGWIFFDKYITSAWIETYSAIIYNLGLCLFPCILLMVYSDLAVSTILIIGLILVIFAKILMFLKWLTLFFKNMYGLLFLIVYFCALEILPCFLLVQGLLQTNIILQIKL